MKKVLVTGSSGFIGNYLVQELIKSKYQVKGIDIQNPIIPWMELDFEYCNILDEQHILQVIDRFKPEVLVHLAAKTNLNEKATLDYYSANMEGVENLIRAINQSNSIQRCIFTSSQLVCRVGYAPNHDSDYNPNTLYGQSKVMTEKIVRSNDGGGVDWCIVRPTTIWGPGMSDHYQRLFKMIQKNQYFHVGTQPLYKSYGYIGNISYQYIKLIEADSNQINRKTFYLADYEPLSLRDWINSIQRKMGANSIKTIPETTARSIAKLGDLINKLG